MGERRARTLEEIAALVGGTVVVHRPVVIRGVAGIDTAGPEDVTFYENPKFLPQLKASPPGAVLVSAALDDIAAAQIRVDGRPYLKFIELVHALHPPAAPRAGIHPSAVVAPDSVLASDIAIGPLACVESGARVGARTVIGAQAHVGAGAVIGADCHLFPRAVVCAGSRLGDRVLVHCGAVIGDDGFGYVQDGTRHVKVPHLGGVIIEDDVEIGANTTVDRATFGTTIVGAGTKIDNLVMIAHNVRVGRRCILAGQVGIAGSSRVGDDTILAGQVGIAGGVSVGARVIASSKAGIAGNVRDGQVVGGFPAVDHRGWRRSMAVVRRLPEMLARLRVIERRLGIERADDGEATE
jgi:UDP-3-O-[3-hydroxymyristoyl] glucosamine N-acyltransferase